ncbi:MAG: response regulator [bacterium]
MSASPTATQTDRRILVIDDEEVVHASLRKILSRLGLGVEAVYSAQQGLDQLAQGPFDLIITDLMMPGMNGIELLEALHERKCHTPILMITGYPTIRTAVQALRMGAMDYIAKPYTRKELLAPIKRALRLDESDSELELEQRQDAPRPEDLTPGDEVYLPHHSWARFQQEGTFLLGMEASFLQAIGTPVSCARPEEMDLIEQGYIGIRLVSAEGDEHGIAMPLSGQVLEVNTAALNDLSKLTADQWLLRLLPSRLAAELALLVKR